MLSQFFGGPPLIVIIKLTILSVIVGVVLSALGLSPYDILDSFEKLVMRVYEMGFDAIDLAGRYFLLGAVIVFPIWLISRIMKRMGGRGRL